MLINLYLFSMIFQKEIILEPKKRGFHLITDDVISHLPDYTGIVNIFIKHTSASLTINENADPSVRLILKLILTKWFQKMKIILHIHQKVLMTCHHI